MKSEDLLQSIIQTNGDIKYEEESLDIDISACSMIPLVRSASLFNYFSPNDDCASSACDKTIDELLKGGDKSISFSDHFVKPSTSFDNFTESKKTKRKLASTKKKKSEEFDTFINELFPFSSDKIESNSKDGPILPTIRTEDNHDDKSISVQIIEIEPIKPIITGPVSAIPNFANLPTKNSSKNQEELGTLINELFSFSPEEMNTVEKPPIIKTEKDVADIKSISIQILPVELITPISEPQLAAPNFEDLPKPRIEYLCHNCNVIYSSRLDFEKHYRETYNTNPIYTCQLCKKQMENMRSFRGHYYRHTTAYKIQCTKCAKKFLNQTLLEQHDATAHRITEIIQKCTDCDEEFTDFDEFKLHCRRHKIEEKEKTKEMKWKCPDCGKMLMNRGSLIMHAKIHKGDRQYECTICPQKFVQKVNLLNHIKTHTGDKPYSCLECGKCFVGKSQLMRHNNYHLNDRPFECEICNKMYKSERDLKLHHMIHSDSRPHVCSHCNKSFLSSSKLKQHYNIHTGARPFKCKYCTKDFTNFPNWLKHIRRRHKVDHKTGKQLEKMPNFLKKESAAPPHTAAEGPDDLLVENKVKNKNPKKKKQKVEAAEEPLIKVDSLYEISLEDTLPLNTSDEVERAASILMQQTLDIEEKNQLHRNNMVNNLPGVMIMDGVEYEMKGSFLKSEPLLTFSQPSQLQLLPQDTTANQLNFNLPTIFTYSPQLQSCIDSELKKNDDILSSLLPLPPITTMKNKRNLIDHTNQQLFPTNVL